MDGSTKRKYCTVILINNIQNKDMKINAILMRFFSNAPFVRSLIADFVSIAVALVTKRYDALMKEQKALEPETKVCSDKVTARNNTCMNCMSGITQCGE